MPQLNTEARINFKTTSDTSGIDKTSDSINKLSKQERQARDASKSLAFALGGLATSAAVAAFDSIRLASEVEEMQAKFDTVFNKTGGEVTSQLEAFADSVGRGTSQLKGMASSFGDTLKPMGFTEENAADLSVELTQLATDLSSFNNMTMDESLRRLRGTLIGSHENALEFGVVINENTLKSQMLADGTADLTGKEKELAKVQARINLLMEGTADAQGDAERTSDSFANKSRALQADLKSLRIEIGQQLLPIATEFVDFLGRSIPDLDEIKTAIDNNKESIVFLGGAILTSLIPALKALGGFIATSVIAPMASLLPYFAVGGAIALGIAFLVKKFGGIEEVTKNVMKGLQEFADFAAGRMERLKQIMGEVTGISPEGLSNIFETANNKVQSYVGQASVYADQFNKKVVQALAGRGMDQEQAGFVDILKNFSSIAGRVFDNLSPVIEDIKTQLKLAGQIIDQELKPAFEDMKATLKPLIIELLPVLKFGVKALAVILGGILATAVAVIVGGLNGIANAIPFVIRAFEGIVQFIRGFAQFWTGVFRGDIALAWEGFKQAIAGGRDFITNVGNAILKYLTGFVKGFLGFFKAIYDTLVGNSIIPDLVEKIEKFIQNMITFVLDKINSFKQSFINVFEDIKTRVSDIVGGIKKTVEDIIEKINQIRNFSPSGAISNIRDRLPDFFADGVRNFSGGMAVVGERGPELVDLPRGSSVYSNAESRNMLRGSDGQKNVNINVTNNIQDPVDLERMQRDLAYKVKLAI